MIDIPQTIAAIKRAADLTEQEIPTFLYKSQPREDVVTLCKIAAALEQAEQWQTSGLGRVLVIPIDATDKETT